MSTIKVEVVGSEVREVVSKKTGEIMRFNEQTAYVHDVQKYPFAIKFDVAKGQQPYPPGFYTLAPENFFAGDFGKLSVKGSLILRPLVSDAKAKAA